MDAQNTAWGSAQFPVRAAGTWQSILVTFMGGFSRNRAAGLAAGLGPLSVDRFENGLFGVG